MTRRTQYFSPDDDETENDYKELESPEIETGTLAIDPEQSTSSQPVAKGMCFYQ